MYKTFSSLSAHQTKTLTWIVGSKDSATATFNFVGRTRLKLSSLCDRVVAMRF